MNKNRKSLIKKLIIGAVIVLILVAALWFGLRFFEDRFKADEDQFGDHGDWGNEEVMPEETVLSIGDMDMIYTDQVKTYLIMGTDNTGKADPTGQHGDMADFMLLLMINNTRGTYGFVQLDRDTMTDVTVIDENGEELGTTEEQLCIAHWYGGTDELRNQNTVDTVSYLMGYLPIDGYFSLQMKDIAAFNNAIGGVVVTINGDLTKLDPDFKDGAEVLITDDKVEKFVRARQGVGEGTNKERMARQRQYMDAVYSRTINQLREAPDYIDTLYGDLKDIIQSNVSSKEVSQIATAIRSMDNLGFMELPGTSKEGDTLGDGIIHAEFYLNDDSVYTTLRKIIKFSAVNDTSVEADDTEETDEEDR